VSRRWRHDLDRRIADLEALRDDLTSCIGCGCLSLQTCRLFNTEDAAASRGAGARYLLGDDPAEVVGYQV
jgi:MerR family transcriptional regulator, redox-sensitive transcriptional activator SoxR